MIKGSCYHLTQGFGCRWSSDIRARNSSSRHSISSLLTIMILLKRGRHGEGLLSPSSWLRRLGLSRLIRGSCDEFWRIGRDIPRPKLGRRERMVIWLSSRLSILVSSRRSDMLDDIRLAQFSRFGGPFDVYRRFVTLSEEQNCLDRAILLCSCDIISDRNKCQR